MRPENPACIPDFFDEATCRAVRRAMDAGSVEPAEILENGLIVDDRVRRASSIEIDPLTLAAVEGRLDGLRAWLSDQFGLTLGSREGTGLLRYGEGGFYGPHRDRADDPDWPGAARRQVAVVVFLNARGFTGGELVLYSDEGAGIERDPLVITPREGLLVAFGAAQLHEVWPVSGGVRDVMVDWFY